MCGNVLNFVYIYTCICAKICVIYIVVLHFFLSLSPSFLSGSGKNQKDAAAVRANHPIPTGCGIYYYEVKIINKGRDG